MPGFLSYANRPKLCSWLANVNCILIDNHVHVVFVGYLINKQIIITTRNMVDRRKPFFRRKTSFL